MTDQPKTPTYPVLVTWESFTPDRRQWKPSMPVIRVNKDVRVDVPLTAEYFANSNDLIVMQLTAGAHVEGILTPLGMRYIIDQFENTMSEVAKAEPEPSDFESSNDEWEDKPEPETTTTENQEDVTWEDDTDATDTTKTDKPIDLEWEN